MGGWAPRPLVMVALALLSCVEDASTNLPAASTTNRRTPKRYNEMRIRLWREPVARINVWNLFANLVVPGAQVVMFSKSSIRSFLAKPITDSPYVVFVLDFPYQSRDISTLNWQIGKRGADGKRMCILDDPLLIQLFVEDWNELNVSHPKLTVLPIGFESRSIRNHKDRQFFKIATSLPPTASRKVRVLCIAHHSKQAKGLKTVVSGSRLGPFPRRDMVRALQGRSYIDFPPLMPREEVLRAHANYSFELCPEGNGLDTHRFYESILLGTIPIVKRCQMSRSVYWRFPHVVVDEWEDIRPDHLETMHKLLAPLMDSAQHRVKMAYWINVVESALEFRGFNRSTYLDNSNMLLSWESA